MRPFPLLALLFSFAATPAGATQGLDCRTVAPEGVQLTVVIGSLGVAGATLTHGEERRSTFENGGLVLGQNWIDERALLIDLFGPNYNERIARLRAGRGGALETSALSGWLDYAGRRWRILCTPA